jgi:predicted methyltransferase
MIRIVVLIALFLAGTAGADIYQDAVDHPGRPGSDREDDDRRKPAEAMAFAGVSAGEIVLEVGAGRGYTTELAARLVGADGKVYAHGLDPARVIGNRLPNVITVPAQPSDLGERFAAAGMQRGGVDRVLAFFSLHDGYLNDDNDMQRAYRTLLGYLKPGGELIVMDNCAAAGSELTYTADLHRIDEAFLKADILKSGFEFVSASDFLRNPDDDLQSSWFEDTETRPAGYQDRFAFRFRKP